PRRSEPGQGHLAPDAGGGPGEGGRKRVASVSTKRGGLRRVSGRPAALGAEAGKRGFQAIALSREIFGQTSGDR
ncbi:MAG: hypothetical protein ACK5TO_07010, partial [Planctomycetaceae bacterium]